MRVLVYGAGVYVLCLGCTEAFAPQSSMGIRPQRVAAGARTPGAAALSATIAESATEIMARVDEMMRGVRPQRGEGRSSEVPLVSKAETKQDTARALRADRTKERAKSEAERVMTEYYETAEPTTDLTKEDSASVLARVRDMLAPKPAISSPLYASSVTEKQERIRSRWNELPPKDDVRDGPARKASGSGLQTLMKASGSGLQTIMPGGSGFEEPEEVAERIFRHQTKLQTSKDALDSDDKTRASGIPELLPSSAYASGTRAARRETLRAVYMQMTPLQKEKYHLDMQELRLEAAKVKSPCPILYRDASVAAPYHTSAMIEAEQLALLHADEDEELELEEGAMQRAMPGLLPAHAELVQSRQDEYFVVLERLQALLPELASQCEANVVSLTAQLSSQASEDVQFLIRTGRPSPSTVFLESCKEYEAKLIELSSRLNVIHRDASPGFAELTQAHKHTVDEVQRLVLEASSVYEASLIQVEEELQNTAATAKPPASQDNNTPSEFAGLTEAAVALLTYTFIYQYTCAVMTPGEMEVNGWQLAADESFNSIIRAAIETANGLFPDFMNTVFKVKSQMIGTGVPAKAEQFMRMLQSSNNHAMTLLNKKMSLGGGKLAGRSDIVNALKSTKMALPPGVEKALGQPEIMKALQNTKVIKAMVEMQTGGPAAMQKYKNDPEFMKLLMVTMTDLSLSNPLTDYQVNKPLAAATTATWPATRSDYDTLLSPSALGFREMGPIGSPPPKARDTPLLSWDAVMPKPKEEMRDKPIVSWGAVGLQNTKNIPTPPNVPASASTSDKPLVSWDALEARQSMDTFGTVMPKPKEEMRDKPIVSWGAASSDDTAAGILARVNVMMKAPSVDASAAADALDTLISQNSATLAAVEKPIVSWGALGFQDTSTQPNVAASAAASDTPLVSWGALEARESMGTFGMQKTKETRTSPSPAPAAEDAANILARVAAMAAEDDAKIVGAVNSLALELDGSPRPDLIPPPPPPSRAPAVQLSDALSYASAKPTGAGVQEDASSILERVRRVEDARAMHEKEWERKIAQSRAEVQDRNAQIAKNFLAAVNSLKDSVTDTLSRKF